MIKPLKIIYKNTIRTSNGTIENEGPNSPSIIIFRNQGTSIAYVLGNVKIFPGESWQLKKRSRNRDRKQLYGDIRHIGSRIREQLSRYSRIL